MSGLDFIFLMLFIIVVCAPFIVDYCGKLGFCGIFIFGVALLLKIGGEFSTSSMTIASIIAAAFIIVGTILAAREREKEEEWKREQEREWAREEKDK